MAPFEKIHEMHETALILARIRGLDADDLQHRHKGNKFGLFLSAAISSSRTAQSSLRSFVGSICGSVRAFWARGVLTRVKLILSATISSSLKAESTLLSVVGSI